MMKKGWAMNRDYGRDISRENCAVVGNRIRLARKSKNMTQEKLGRLVCADGKYISRLESGKSMPSITKLVQLSRALGRSCDYFIWDIDVGEDETGSYVIYDEAKNEDFAESVVGRNEWFVIHMVREFVESVGDAVNLCRMPEDYM